MQYVRYKKRIIAQKAAYNRSLDNAFRDLTMLKIFYIFLSLDVIWRSIGLALDYCFLKPVFTKSHISRSSYETPHDDYFKVTNDIRSINSIVLSFEQ